MSAMKTLIATLCLIVAQMQVSTALEEDSSKSLMVQYWEPRLHDLYMQNV